MKSLPETLMIPGNITVTMVWIHQTHPKCEKYNRGGYEDAKDATKDAQWSN